MRGIFFTEDIAIESGIHKKVILETQTFHNNGLNIELKMDQKKDFIWKILKRFPLFSVQNRLFNIREIPSEIDFIYIRKPFAIDFSFYKTSKKIKKQNSNIKIILEIPTYPYDKENLYIKNYVLLSKDKFWRKRLRYFIDRIVTYSKDEKIFDIETICISNGVDFSNLPIKKKDFSPLSSEINLIAVATLSFWHGYDRLIEGIAKYNQSPSPQNTQVKLHIVGNGEQKVIDYYVKLIEDNNLAETVILHGQKAGQALDEVFEISDIAIDSLGRHRSGVFYNSSLKGKEYIARGFPVVSGVETELDAYSSYKYYFRVPANDDLIDINEILIFYEKIILEESSEQIKTNIRDFGRRHFDMNEAFYPIIKYLLKEAPDFG